jgi:MoxR-like ATPase
MARHADPTAALVYPVFQEWLTGSLVTGQSLLTSERVPWTLETLEELEVEFIGAPDVSEKIPFLEKLQMQIEGVSDDAVVLMAELHVVHFLMVWKGAIGGAKKVSDVQTILSWRESTAGIELPDALVEALQVGVAHPGQWAVTYRHLQLGYLIRFAKAALEAEHWLDIAVDPHALKDLVESIDTGGRADSAQRLSVLHLALPDHFEPIAQPKHKDAIVARYGGLLDEVPDDVDEAILQIRGVLTPQLGDLFDWYAEPTVRAWNRDEKSWNAFCQWASRFREMPAFDEMERDYKLALVDRLVAARTAMADDAEGWADEFKRAIRASNLVAVMTKTRVADWVEKDPDAARLVFLGFWQDDASPAERMDALDQNRPEGELKTPGERLALGSVLLMAEGAEDHPPLKITALQKAWLLAGWGNPQGLSVGETYGQAMAFFDEMCLAVPTLRDRLDAQSAVWALLNYGECPEGWSDTDWAELSAFRGDPPPELGPGDDHDEVVDPDERSEVERRRARYQAMLAAWEADEVAQAKYADAIALLEAAAPTARAALTRATEDLDIDRLRSSIANDESMPQQMRRGSHPNYLAHAVNLAGSNLPAVAGAIVAAYQPPASLDEAVARIDALDEVYSAMDGVGASYVGMTPLAASAFWELQDAGQITLWAWVEDVLKRLGWLVPGSTPATRYRAYAEVIADLDDDPRRAVRVLAWFRKGGLAGVDPTAPERCRHNQRLARAFYDNTKEYPDQEAQTAAERNAQALIGDLRYLTWALRDDVAEAVGSEIGDALPPLRYGAALPYRHDAFAGWRLVAEPSTPSIRVWVTCDRVVVGLHPGWTQKGWYDEAADRARPALPEGFEFFRLRTGAAIYQLEPRGTDLPGGEFVVGRELAVSEAGTGAIRAAVIDACLELRPVIEALRGTIDAPAEDGDVVISGEIDHLDAAAADLLIDRAELDEIVDLLHDRGQVVFYGPPGTGKTFLAKRLAKALAADRPERSAIVQFHPATTYEDFIEGLRPSVVDGQVSYELLPGPLVRMAAAAKADPSGTYVIVIDEINRANLPKVLGELLFLLEYREEPVRLLYRPEEPFTLPENLLFIGTMNTADRSIALVDAAMRRRFHFVGFFPHQGVMKGLLRRWLRAHHRPEHVADFVAAVNDELRVPLGDHLLLGPSFFMKEDLSAQALERIWEHNVFPFLEEQFWGRTELDDWRWPAVLARHGASLQGGAAGDAGAGAGDEVDEFEGDDGFTADEPIE